MSSRQRRGGAATATLLVVAWLAALPLPAASATPWSVSIADRTADEGGTGETPTFSFTVTAQRAATDPALDTTTLNLVYSTSSEGRTATAGTACSVSGADYVTVTDKELPLTIQAGQSSGTASASVTICGDGVDEDEETFVVNVQPAPGETRAQINDGTAVGTIENDDDPTVTVSVAPTDRPTSGSDSGRVDFIREGAASRDVTIHLNLERASNEALHLTYATAAGSATNKATANEDYTPIVSGEISIGANTYSASAPEATLTVRILGDTIDENDEGFALTLTPKEASGGATVPATTPFTIDNDDDPAISVSSVRIAEGAAGEKPKATFTVSLSNNSLEAVNFDWTTSSTDPPSATAGGDYVASSATNQSIPAGSLTKTFDVTINGDDGQEPDETFKVVVTRSTSSAGRTTNGSAEGVGTILNDDGVTPAISITDASRPEGKAGEITEFPVKVSLSAPTQEQVKVDFKTADDTATEATKDYEPLEGTLTFEPGELEKTITVWVYGDDFPGPSESFFVNLLTPVNATIADAQATITIENDDGPVIHVDDAEITEPDTGETVTATLTFTLSETSPNEVTVKYETLDGTATAGEDYSEQTGTLKITAGQKTATVSIPIRGDDVTEEDETFTVELSEPAEGTPARDSITITILDDEAGEPGAGSILVQARDTDDSCPSGSVPEDGYADASGSVHEAAIDCLVWWKVTSGDGRGGYSPTQPVTRGQMATFIARTIAKAGVTLPADPENRFTDDDGDVHELSINQLAELEVVSGRSDGTFRPAESVSRAAMATFLARAYEAATGEALTTSTDHFSDDSGDTHEANINAVAEVRVAVGDGRGSYSPAASVRRDQMASFLVRLLDLFVEESHAETPS